MPTLTDVIRRISIQASQTGADQTSASLLKLAGAQDAVAVATTNTEKATLSIQGKLNSLMKTLDAEYASEQKMASIEKTLAAARDQGIISLTRENELLALASDKYKVAGESAEIMAKGIDTAKEAAMGLIAGLGAGTALVGLMELPSKIMESVKQGAETFDAAQTIGITTKSLQELDYAAATTGVSTDTMNAALEKFSKGLGTAATGSGTLSKVLKDNHVVITGDLTKDFENYANLVQGATNAEQKNFLVTTAFGKGSADLGNIFSRGAEGIKDLADEADNANVVLSDGTLESAKQLNDEFVKMQTQLGVTFEDFMINVAPALEGVLDDIIRSVNAVNSVIQAAQMAMPLEQQSSETILKNIAAQQALLKNSASNTMYPVLPGQRGYGRGNVPASATTAGLQSQIDAENAVLATRRGTANEGFTIGKDNGGWGTLPKPTVTPNTAGDAAAARQAAEYQKVTDALNLQLTTLTETDRQKAIDTDLSRAHVDASSAEGQALTKLAGQYYDEKTAIKSVDDATAFFAQTTESAFEGMITGGQSLTDVLGNVEKALMNAVIQAELLGSGPLAGILGTAPTTAGQTGGLFGSIASLLHPNAAGGVYSSPSLSAYRNSIVAEPTFFKFANGGALGVAGEAGPEAIMPLKRGADGRLGVAAANGNAPVFNLSIVTAPGQTADVSQKKNASGGLDVTAIIKGVVKTAVADGSIDSVMQQTYGLKRVGRG